MCHSSFLEYNISQIPAFSHCELSIKRSLDDCRTYLQILTVSWLCYELIISSDGPMTVVYGHRQLISLYSSTCGNNIYDKARSNWPSFGKLTYFRVLI